MQRCLLSLALVALVGSLALQADARRVGPAERSQQDSAALEGARRTLKEAAFNLFVRGSQNSGSESVKAGSTYLPPIDSNAAFAAFAQSPFADGPAAAPLAAPVGAPVAGSPLLAPVAAPTPSTSVVETPVPAPAPSVADSPVVAPSPAEEAPSVPPQPSTTPAPAPAPEGELVGEAPALSPVEGPAGAPAPAPSSETVIVSGSRPETFWDGCPLLTSSCEEVTKELWSCQEYISLYRQCYGLTDMQTSCTVVPNSYALCAPVLPELYQPEARSLTPQTTEVTPPPTEPVPPPPAAPVIPPPAEPVPPPPAEPTPTPTPPATGGGCTYVVNGGDTMYAIGLAYGTDVGTIQALNPGVTPELLQIGQALNVPCTADGSTPQVVNPPPANPPPAAPIDGATSPGGDGIIWGAYAGAGGATGGPGPAYATYHYYGPYYYTSSLYCADAFNPILAAGNGKQLLQYPWTAYCNDKGLGPMSQDKCGRHLRVTNPATGQWVITTVVDMCGQGGVDMDPIAFNAIDGNGAGVRDGHMNVILEWV